MRFGLGALVIFLIALTFRIWHVLEIRDAPFFTMLLGDAEIFDAWAREIRAGDWLGKEVFWYAPLYPYFLGAIYGVLGDDPLIVRAVQAVLGSTSCVLLAYAGRRFFNRATGIAAGLLLALNGPGIFYDSLMHKPILATLFLCLLLYLLGRLVDEPLRSSVWFGAGLTTAAMTLSRENGLIFALAILAWLLVCHETVVSSRVARTSLFLGALTLGLLPVAVRNQVVGGEFHLTASNFGSNLFIGNNPQATGTYVPLRDGRGLPRFERQDATEIAEAAVGHSLSPAEVSRYWTSRALDYVRSRPWDWLTLTGRKIMLLCNALEWPDSEDLYTHEDASLPLRLTDPLTHFGVLAPLAMLGVWVTWSERRRHSILYLMAVAYGLSMLPFFIFGRFRYPLTVLLVLWAAAGLTGWSKFWRSVSRSRMAGCAVAVVAVAVYCNWPIVSKDRIRSGTQTFIGNELQVDDRPDEAAIHLRRAIQLDPENSRAHFNLGATLASQGRTEEAILSYREAVRIQPDYLKALTNLGVLLARRGDLDAAEPHFRKALQLGPQDALSLINLSRLLQLQGQFDEAIRHAEQAAQWTRHQDLEVLERLEGSYAAAGLLDRAAATAREALPLAIQANDQRRSAELRQRLEAYENARSGVGARAE